MSKPIYDYPAILLAPEDVHDGDTFWLVVSQNFDFGFNVQTSFSARQKFRLARCNAPELSTPAGAPARLAALKWLQDHRAGLRVTSLGPDNYGDRWDAEVYDVASGEHLSDFMLTNGFAVKWPA